MFEDVFGFVYTRPRKNWRGYLKEEYNSPIHNQISIKLIGLVT
jgi:hypothetical protein